MVCGFELCILVTLTKYFGNKTNVEVFVLSLKIV